MTPDEKAKLQFSKILTYANGYRELSMFKEALEELSRLPLKYASHSKTLQMKLSIFFDAKDWKAAECTAKEIAMREPNDPGNFINLAYATRRAKTVRKANAILLTAVDRFPNEAIVHYNLACYACLENELESAKARLVKSIALDPKFLNTAKADEDLSPLSEWLQNLEIA